MPKYKRGWCFAMIPSSVVFPRFPFSDSKETGAISINVLVNYSQDFSNTAKCHDLALTQINQHQAHVIFQVAAACGIGALDAPDQQGVFGIGVNTEQRYIHPSIITSAW